MDPNELPHVALYREKAMAAFLALQIAEEQKQLQPWEASIAVRKASIADLAACSFDIVFLTQQIVGEQKHLQWLEAQVAKRKADIAALEKQRERCLAEVARLNA